MIASPGQLGAAKQVEEKWKESWLDHLSVSLEEAYSGAFWGGSSVFSSGVVEQLPGQGIGPQGHRLKVVEVYSYLGLVSYLAVGPVAKYFTAFWCSSTSEKLQLYPFGGIWRSLQCFQGFLHSEGRQVGWHTIPS